VKRFDNWNYLFSYFILPTIYVLYLLCLFILSINDWSESTKINSYFCKSKSQGRYPRPIAPAPIITILIRSIHLLSLNLKNITNLPWNKFFPPDIVVFAGGMLTAGNFDNIVYRHLLRSLISFPDKMLPASMSISSLDD